MPKRPRNEPFTTPGAPQTENANAQARIRETARRIHNKKNRRTARRARQAAQLVPVAVPMELVPEPVPVPMELVPVAEPEAAVPEPLAMEVQPSATPRIDALLSIPLFDFIICHGSYAGKDGTIPHFVTPPNIWFVETALINEFTYFRADFYIRCLLLFPSELVYLYTFNTSQSSTYAYDIAIKGPRSKRSEAEERQIDAKVGTATRAEKGKMLQEYILRGDFEKVIQEICGTDPVQPLLHRELSYLDQLIQNITVYKPGSKVYSRNLTPYETSARSKIDEDSHILRNETGDLDILQNPDAPPYVKQLLAEEVLYSSIVGDISARSAEPRLVIVLSCAGLDSEEQRGELKDQIYAIEQEQHGERLGLMEERNTSGIPQIEGKHAEEYDVNWIFFKETGIVKGVEESIYQPPYDFEVERVGKVNAYMTSFNNRASVNSLTNNVDPNYTGKTKQLFEDPDAQYPLSRLFYEQSVPLIYIEGAEPRLVFGTDYRVPFGPEYPKQFTYIGNTYTIKDCITAIKNSYDWDTMYYIDPVNRKDLVKLSSTLAKSGIDTYKKYVECNEGRGEGAGDETTRSQMFLYYLTTYTERMMRDQPIELFDDFKARVEAPLPEVFSFMRIITLLLSMISNSEGEEQFAAEFNEDRKEMYRDLVTYINGTVLLAIQGSSVSVGGGSAPEPTFIQKLVQEKDINVMFPRQGEYYEPVKLKAQLKSFNVFLHLYLMITIANHEYMDRDVTFIAELEEALRELERLQAKHRASEGGKRKTRRKRRAQKKRVWFKE